MSCFSKFAVGVAATGAVSQAGAVRFLALTEYQNEAPALTAYQTALASPAHPHSGFEGLAKSVEGDFFRRDLRSAADLLEKLLGEELRQRTTKAALNSRGQIAFPFLDAVTGLESVSGTIEPETLRWRAFVHDQVWNVVENTRFPVADLPDRWSYPMSGMWEWVECGVWEFDRRNAKVETRFKRLYFHLQLITQDGGDLGEYGGESQFALLISKLYQKAIGEASPAVRRAELDGCGYLVRFLQHLASPDQTGNGAFSRSADEAVDLLLAKELSSRNLAVGSSSDTQSTPDSMPFLQSVERAQEAFQAYVLGRVTGFAGRENICDGALPGKWRTGSETVTESEAGPAPKVARTDGDYRLASTLDLDDVFSVTEVYWTSARAGMAEKAPNMPAAELDAWVQDRQRKIPAETAFKVVAKRPDGGVDAIKTWDSFNLEARTPVWNAACVSFEAGARLTVKTV